MKSIKKKVIAGIYLSILVSASTLTLVGCGDASLMGIETPDGIVNSPVVVNHDVSSVDTELASFMLTLMATQPGYTELVLRDRAYCSSFVEPIASILSFFIDESTIFKCERDVNSPIGALCEGSAPEVGVVANLALTHNSISISDLQDTYTLDDSSRFWKTVTDIEGYESIEAFFDEAYPTGVEELPLNNLSFQLQYSEDDSAAETMFVSFFFSSIGPVTSPPEQE